jgi:hypothetical protein
VMKATRFTSAPAICNASSARGRQPERSR